MTTDIQALFSCPPSGYGQVPFYWWVGAPLTKERLAWQMERLDECGGISGLQINYPHGFRNGGDHYGLSIPSDPPLFSDDWWGLVEWFMTEAKTRGWSISLSDYTLGPGQGWCFDELVKSRPDLSGAMLKSDVHVVEEGPLELPLPDDLLIVAACLHESDGPPLNLQDFVTGNRLVWNVPDNIDRVVIIRVERVPLSLDPMHPDSGRLYADAFFGQFERRFPGEGGQGFNFFFSDELDFNLRGHLWNDRFDTIFQERKGYALIPVLPALFIDCGPITSKVRLDYFDVMVALSEEGFFKPVFEWHEQRGMTYGCDHGGRGRDVIEFGDYFRTQRWNQGPGCDQPRLEADLIKNKVASSIAHLYQRPRVWLEGFHSSGWGTSTNDLTSAILSNFAQGHNLLSLHGLYYTLQGGYWEWAPPCNHFRMPYWPHMNGLLKMVNRLSFLLSQGVHCCDVAVLYPVAPKQAKKGDVEAVNAAFSVAEALYENTIDFDFMDFQSLERAELDDGQLCVSGERYRVLILPAMRAIRWSTLRKVLSFKRSGGLVYALGALPESSDRIGADDPELDAVIADLFEEPESVFSTSEQLVGQIGTMFRQDITVLSSLSTQFDFIHRKIDAMDLYMLHGAPAGTELELRSKGTVERWDPWSGTMQPLRVLAEGIDYTKVRLPEATGQVHLIVFRPGTPEFESDRDNQPDFVRVAIEGDWEFELKPTMDNRFGDFHWPPKEEFIGAEVRQLDYCEDTPNDEDWQRVTIEYGPGFIRCHEMPASKTSLTPPPGDRHDFSWHWGIEGDAGFQGCHGLKGRVHDEFLAIGHPRQERFEIEYGAEESDTILWTTVRVQENTPVHLHMGSIRPDEIWIDGKRILDRTIVLCAGVHPLILTYSKDRPGRTYFSLSTSVPSKPKPKNPIYPKGKKPVFEASDMTSKWLEDEGLILFDVRSDAEVPLGWYRFTSPPGLEALSIEAFGKVAVKVNGSPATESSAGYFEISEPSDKPVEVLIRIEQTRGRYGGSAFKNHVRLHCRSGRIALGDWSSNDSLACYSGGAWYRKKVNLPELEESAILDLGNLTASAEIRINGEMAGVLIASPWRVDIGPFVKPGENLIEVLVYNTLSNHYTTIPTMYRGRTESGLIGPVHIELRKEN